MGWQYVGGVEGIVGWQYVGGLYGTTTKARRLGLADCGAVGLTLVCVLQVNHLEDYMGYRKLPKQLQRRTMDYYRTRYGGRWFDEKNVLNMVSKSLREVRKRLKQACCLIGWNEH